MDSLAALNSLLTPDQWAAITNLGDGAVMVPLGAVLLLNLLGQDRRAAMTWAAGIIFGVGLTLLGKLLHYRALVEKTGILLDNPSGHALISLMVLGGLARYAFVLLPGGLAWVTRLTCPLVILAIALSRLALRTHTPAEVVAGLGVGLLALGPCLLRPAAPVRQPRPLWLAPAALVLLTYGHQWYLETLINRAAALLG